MTNQNMKLFIFGFILLLVTLTEQLPVKESGSTEKDPNKHTGEGDKEHNLENVIGKIFQHSSSLFSSSANLTTAS